MNIPKKIISLLVLAILPSCLMATNGDNLIAIGPVARGMGGLSVSYPQDPVSAVFANPAAMCFGPYCPMSEVNASVTAFMPTVKASLKDPVTGNQISADSDDPIYFIPAIGISHPLPFGEQNRWRFGISAYGVSGLGVDYRGTALDDAFPGTGGMLPYSEGLYTQLQKMKVAPAIAYQVAPNLSIGGSIHFNYSELEIGSQDADGTTFGYQIGMLYTPRKNVFVGLSYTSAQEIDYKDILLTQTGTADLALESPQQVAAGISIELMDKRLLLGIEGRWINWSNATGYKDFEWDDQYALSIGGQYQLIPEKLIVRAGYNYANNPVSENDGWDGSFDFSGQPAPNDVVMVQGTPFPRYYYETFRVVGFPAIVEHHATVGFTYNVNERLALNFAYMHAFENTITESGTNPFGAPTEVESSLYEDSIEIGVSWRF